VEGVFDLGSADAELGSGNSHDAFGMSVAAAGDIDGDGLDDILVGAPDFQWQAGMGRSYLFLGNALSAGGSFGIGAAHASFIGQWSDLSGLPVYGPGDVDGDGLDDLFIGAVSNDEGGTSAGKSYLFFGSTASLGGDFFAKDADLGFVGEAAWDHSGRSLSGGDFDGDGLADLLIGAPDNAEGGPSAGKTYLFFGANLPAGGDQNLSAADVVFVGAAGEGSGLSVSGAGDVDRDGLDDLLIGAPDNAEGGPSAGKTYLFLGSSLSAGSSFDLTAADASFHGLGVDELSGSAVSSAGDVDGDRRPDLLVGAPGTSSAPIGFSGATYVLLSPY
jgi:hypothetical protein